MARAEEIDGLDCEGSVHAGALLVLRARLHEVWTLREKALDFTDIEGVHDMRVASRRLRSALRDFAPFLRKAVPQRRLKALADALGLVRDEDVAIEALEKLRAKAPEQLANGIAHVTDERRWKRERAREALESALSEDALAAMQEKYSARFERALRPPLETGENAEEHKAPAVSFRHAGREIILARFRELQDLSLSLYHPFRIKELHRMRIAAKRLRYAIELFSSCWGESLLEMAKEIAALQSSLGELHDCDVWIIDLGARLDARGPGQRAEGAQQMEGHARQAGVWLLGHFVKER
ncbi:MAG: CHAD domain-containing protein, partial [Acidobacteria bacterium]|nr:CHAD domain-containing protein [Acidobacteriota bacterium]